MCAREANYGAFWSALDRFKVFSKRSQAFFSILERLAKGAFGSRYKGGLPITRPPYRVIGGPAYNG